MASTKVGHTLAKGLGINVNYRNDATENLSRGESVISSASGDNYIEHEVTVGDWWSAHRPTIPWAKSYVRSLFPFLDWITRYNTTWLSGDLIAGITVGFVVVPQGMAYAILAKLPPEYGLYTSFVGFLLYWAFATSKDITIGTVAVMSQLVGNIVIKVQKKHPDIPAEEIARSLAVIAGSVILAIGLTRTGWIVEWISLPAITAFMTGSAITIAAGQVPNLLGIPNINTRGAGYRVIIDTLKGLPNAKLDAALGMTALFLLYGIRMVFSYLTKKQPQRKKLWFFLSTLRIAFVLLLYILISWTITRGVKDPKKARIKILGTVPRGFKHAGAPTMNARTISAFASDLPATIIVLLIEHIAISKSFGRINNYTINPSQELIAIGFSNILGPFLGAYPQTGSFSRTAIKSKAGVRTPLAGIFTAILVLLALYALTSMFYYIPSSALAAIIIHAVGDLITPPKTVYQFWEVSPVEVPVFFLGVFVSIFSNIENGIYATMGASAGIILFRFSKARGRFLGRAKVHNVRGATNVTGDEKTGGIDDISGHNDADSTAGHGSREIWLPLDRSDGLNPEISLETPKPGIFVFGFDDGFNYPNSQHYFNTFTDFIFKHTRRTTTDTYAKLGDRPWNDPGPRRGETVVLDTNKPILKAIILDFSAVNQVDVSSIQNLVDVRNQLDRYASPSTVSWHFANIRSPWTRRSLAAAGFGYPKYNSVESRWRSVIAVGGADEFNHLQEAKLKDVERDSNEDITPEKSHERGSDSGDSARRVPLYGVNRPFFHVDVQAALESAEAIVEQQEVQGST